jgi:hypothetical protein
LEISSFPFLDISGAGIDISSLGDLTSPDAVSVTLAPDSAANGGSSLSDGGGFGIISGGSGGFGEGMGVAGTGSTGLGFFWGGGRSFGAFGTVGGMAGGGNVGFAYPGPTQNGKNGTYGAYAGLGLGLFLTNANTSSGLDGPFDTLIVNLNVIEIQFATSSPTWELSVTTGPGVGAGISYYSTNTWGDPGPWHGGYPTMDPDPMDDPCSWGACQ